MGTTLRTADLGTRAEKVISDALSQGGNLVLERDGEPVWVIVSAEDFGRLASQEAATDHLLDEVHRRNQHFDPEEVERDAEAAVQEYRREHQARKTA